MRWRKKRQLQGASHDCRRLLLNLFYHSLFAVAIWCRNQNRTAEVASIHSPSAGSGYSLRHFVKRVMVSIFFRDAGRIIMHSSCGIRSSVFSPSSTADDFSISIGHMCLHPSCKAFWLFLSSLKQSTTPIAIPTSTSQHVHQSNRRQFRYRDNQVKSSSRKLSLYLLAFSSERASPFARAELSLTIEFVSPADDMTVTEDSFVPYMFRVRKIDLFTLNVFGQLLHVHHLLNNHVQKLLIASS